VALDPVDPDDDDDARDADASLVARMRDGDRDAAVEYLWQRRDLILQFGRKRMRPDDHVDREPEDLFSTLLRRVDLIVKRGRFTAQTSKEADRLVFAVLRRAIANVFRHGRVRRDGQARAAISDTVEDDLVFVDPDRLRAMVAALDADEYALFVGKLRGASSRELAEQLSINEDTVRQRWHALRKRLARDLLGATPDQRTSPVGGQLGDQLGGRGQAA